MRFRKKLVGLVVIALFLVSIAGAASATEFDLPKWVIVPEDSTFSDVTLFCGLDAMDTTNNVTPCYLDGTLANATIHFNSTTGYPKLVTGKIGNAFEFDRSTGDYVSAPLPSAFASGINTSVTFTAWVMYSSQSSIGWVVGASSSWGLQISLTGALVFLFWHDGAYDSVSTSPLTPGQWYFVVGRYNIQTGKAEVFAFDASGTLVAYNSKTITPGTALLTQTWVTGIWIGYTLNGVVDEARIYSRALTDDEIKLLYLAGRKKLSEPANFRQIFSPMIDLTRDRATFYAGLEVSTTDPNGYVPVPESAVNMSITSAPRLKSDYTNADFYYQGHYWYRADKIQFNLPIQFETVRESGGFSKEILLDEDSKTFVYEKEFKVTNPTAAKLNVVYAVDPTALGFSPLDYPKFEIDGVSMAEWRPSNSSTLYLIHTDVLEPGEVSTHWIKSTWTITKQELNFPASWDDFKGITNWSIAEKLAKNAAEGKTDTYVRVIKIDSNADLANMTVLVPLKDVNDQEDVLEAVALTGSRETLQVEKLEDGKIVVKVPSEAFVSGHAEIKVLYNKSGGSWFSQLLEKIRSLMKKILSLFGVG